MFSGYPLALRRCLNSKRLFSNAFLEELVLSNLIALPLMKPFFYPWWVALGEVRELENKGKDRPARTPQVAFVVASQKGHSNFANVTSSFLNLGIKEEADHVIKMAGKTG